MVVKLVVKLFSALATLSLVLLVINVLGVTTERELLSGLLADIYSHGSPDSQTQVVQRLLATCAVPNRAATQLCTNLTLQERLRSLCERVREPRCAILENRTLFEQSCSVVQQAAISTTCDQYQQGNITAQELFVEQAKSVATVVLSSEQDTSIIAQLEFFKRNPIILVLVFVVCLSIAILLAHENWHQILRHSAFVFINAGIIILLPFLLTALLEPTVDTTILLESFGTGSPHPLSVGVVILAIHSVYTSSVVLSGVALLSVGLIAVFVSLIRRSSNA